MKLVFATNNLHKLSEVQSLLSNSISGKDIAVLSMKDINCFDEIDETGINLEENSLIKAKYIWDNFNVNCFADDTGLEIEALNGRPGVYSARYAGKGCSFADNVNKILNELEGIDNRRACFRTVITLILDGDIYSFEGRTDGDIIASKRGSEGFGYDPVFIPDGYNETFAQMPLELKNKISHRGIAMSKLVDFFNNRAK